MLKRPINLIKRQIAENRGRYVLSAISVIIGLALGIIGGMDYSDAESGLLSDFFSGLSGFSSGGLLYEGVIQSAVLTGIILIFGLSPVGCIAIPAVCAYKGLAAGFSLGAVYSVYKIRALLFGAIAIIPSAIFWLPALLFASVQGIKCSAGLLRIFSRRCAGDSRDDMAAMVISAPVMLIGLIFSKIVEIYFVPSVLNVVGGIYL